MEPARRLWLFGAGGVIYFKEMRAVRTAQPNRTAVALASIKNTFTFTPYWR